MCIQKQIVWIGAVKDKLRDNPFLAPEAFDNEVARNDYLNEFRVQLDEESTELFNRHSNIAQKEIQRASTRLKKEKKSKKSSSSSDSYDLTQKKKKRLFGWFRKSKNKQKVEKSKELEEKSNNLLVAYDMSDNEGDDNDHIAPLSASNSQNGLTQTPSITKRDSYLLYRQRSPHGDRQKLNETANKVNELHETQNQNQRTIFHMKHTLFHIQMLN